MKRGKTSVEDGVYEGAGDRIRAFEKASVPAFFICVSLTTVITFWHGFVGETTESIMLRYLLIVFVSVLVFVFRLVRLLASIQDSRV